jgi:hypothetical protein
MRWLLCWPGLPTWSSCPLDLQLLFPGVRSWILAPYWAHLDPPHHFVVGGWLVLVLLIYRSKFFVFPPVPVWLIPLILLEFLLFLPASSPLLALGVSWQLPLLSTSSHLFGIAVGGLCTLLMPSGLPPFVLGSGVLPRTMCPPWFGNCILLSTNYPVRQNALLWLRCLSPMSPLFPYGDALVKRLYCTLGPGVMNFRWVGECIGWIRS